MKIALKITPQRSTQYAHMTAMLATPEVLASPLGSAVKDIQPITLAGQEFLLTTIEDTSDQNLASLRELIPRLGAVSEAYEYFEQLGDIAGPLLRPIEPQFMPFVPLEMAEARRYKGKTNETFTRVLLNTALFAGEYAQSFTERLRNIRSLSWRWYNAFPRSGFGL